MRSLADGHCLIHSILSCLRAKYGASELSINDLLCKLKNECYLNVAKYMPFFDGDYISFFNLMHKYVDDKSYSMSFCDLVPIMMSNALDEGIVIINDSIDDFFVTVLSPRTRCLVKRWDRDSCIFLLKTLDHNDAYIPAYFHSNQNGPTLVGRHLNSFDLRTDELNKGNVPALDHFDNLAINANTTTQVPNREINLPENVTGGQCDNSTVYSHHGDDVTDSNSVSVFSDLTDSVYSHHNDDITDGNSVPVFSDQAVLNDDSVYSHHGDAVTYSNSVPVSTDQAVLNDDSVFSYHDDDVTDNNSVPVSTGHGVRLNESISPGDAALDTIPYLDTLRTKYPRNLFIAHLNVNNIRYKFYEIHDILNGNRIDIFGISETKIDTSFTDAQFCVEGFKLYRHDRNVKGNGGGIFVYIKDSIPHRILKTHSGITNAIEYMSFEVCFKRRKWFLVYMYKPPKVSDESAWSVLSQLADNFVDSSKLAIFFCDKNHDNILHDLCDVYDLKNVIRGPTCFKGENPTLLDVFLTNKPSSFCNCINIDTGISDFHNLTGVI